MAPDSSRPKGCPVEPEQRRGRSETRLVAARGGRSVRGRLRLDQLERDDGRNALDRLAAPPSAALAGRPGLALVERARNASNARSAPGCEQAAGGRLARRFSAPADGSRLRLPVAKTPCPPMGHTCLRSALAAGSKRWRRHLAFRPRRVTRNRMPDLGGGSLLDPSLGHRAAFAAHHPRLSDAAACFSMTLDSTQGTSLPACRLAIRSGASRGPRHILR